MRVNTSSSQRMGLVAYNKILTGGGWGQRTPGQAGLSGDAHSCSPIGHGEQAAVLGSKGSTEMQTGLDFKVTRVLLDYMSVTQAAAGSELTHWPWCTGGCTRKERSTTARACPGSLLSWPRTAAACPRSPPDKLRLMQGQRSCGACLIHVNALLS